MRLKNAMEEGWPIGAGRLNHDALYESGPTSYDPKRSKWHAVVYAGAKCRRDAAQRHWDAPLIATATASGGTLILVEALADGARLGDIEIHNPFDAAGELMPRTGQLLGL